jgi:hypothetical protein
MKNLASIGVILGLSGATTEMVKDWMKGKDTDLTASDVAINMFKVFGVSEYTKDKITGVTREEARIRREGGDKNARSQMGKPLDGIAGAFVPPYQIFDSLMSGDPKAVRYLAPGIGPYLAEQVRKEAELERETD